MRTYLNENDRYASRWLRNLAHAGHIKGDTIDDRSIADVTPGDLNGYGQAHFFAGIGGWPYAFDLAGWGDRPAFTGSCPCQSFSDAGLKKGFDDDRHLWPIWFKLISENRPPVIFGEQTTSKLALEWLDLVHTDLESEGYSVWATTLGAHSVNAPHRRQRLWFAAFLNVANTDSGGTQRRGEKRKHRQAIQTQGGNELPGAGQPHTGAMGDAPGETGDPQEPRATSGAEEGGGQDPVLDGARGASAKDALADTHDGEHQHEEIREGEGARPRHDHEGASRHDPWGDAIWIECTDGKRRCFAPGAYPLTYSLPGRVGQIRGYGNAIVPQVAAAFVRTVKEALYPEDAQGAHQRADTPQREGKQAAWKTPSAKDSTGAHPNIMEKIEAGEKFGLNDQITMLRGKKPASENLILNPEFVRWLMGYPKAWSECIPTSTKETVAEVERFHKEQAKVYEDIPE